jgi:hypothetical protein
VEEEVEIGHSGRKTFPHNRRKSFVLGKVWKVNAFWEGSTSQVTKVTSADVLL